MEIPTAEEFLENYNKRVEKEKEEEENWKQERLQKLKARHRERITEFLLPIFVRKMHEGLKEFSVEAESITNLDFLSSLDCDDLQLLLKDFNSKCKEKGIFIKVKSRPVIYRFYFIIEIMS